MRLKTTILLLSIYLSGWFYQVEGQYYFTGTDPASIRWKKIESEHFRTIFPESYENEAYRIAGYLESAMAELSPLLNPTRRRGKTDVIIHNYSAESNGYVAWAPRRMEIFPAPRQSSLPFDQIESLVVHEVMHVLQMQALERGFTGYMSYLLGEQITGAVSALLPLWYYEGDAVLYETLNAPGGRGSNPTFNRAMKALYSELPQGYGYDKMLLGSYRNYTPDLYKYGFRMIEYSRLKHGDDLWRSAIENVARRPFLLNPLNQALKNEIGTTKEKLYNETVDTLLFLWRSELLSNPPLQYTTLNPDKKGNYINYCSPTTAGHDSIFAIKSSLSSPSSIVLLTNNGMSEEHILYQGVVYPNLLSYSSGMLVWSERRSDPRWENRSYSVVVLYDVNSGRIHQLTSRSRYFAPSLSPDGSRVVVAENSVENRNFLTILDSETGEVTGRIPVPENGYPQRPEWSAEGDKIVTIILTKRGEKISTYTIAEGRWGTLLECSDDDLQSVALRGDTLFFVSSATGTDNIYMRTPDEEFLKVTSVPFGTANFSLAGSSVVLDSYSWKGNEIISAPITGSQPFDYGRTRESLPSELYRGIPPAGRDSGSYKIFNNDSSDNQLVSQEIQTVITSNDFTVTPYKKWKNLFNIHSWAPFWFDPENITFDSSPVSPGITLLSQNHLSTLVSSAGYEYDRGNHILHGGFIWRGWYPVIDFKMSWGGDPLISRRDDDPTPLSMPRRFSTTSTIYLPLRYRTGRYSQLLQPMFSHYYINRQVYEPVPGTYNAGQHFFTSRLFFSNSHRAAYRDIYPPYAQTFDFTHTAAPFDKTLYGRLTSLRTAFYFPGLFPNHGIRLRLQTEKQDIKRFLHFNRALFPRGYESLIAGKLHTATADYLFPIAYPDLAAGQFLYLKRLRGSLFADFSNATGIYDYSVNSFTEEDTNLFSYGGELLADLHILRIPYQITVGASFGYIPDKGNAFIQAVFLLDIQGFTLGNGNRSMFHP